ncbi:repressible alkaline phosphatase [Verticillium alfalfae VaMs.102]|uniref:alkaline phosphatase n=1 Tax=Verticillium alfalfae (strain VaMs.102 / ATCC MYA-4576 / FGSC 10136) TaxID=526221 RepID=C9SNY9_VERA1|nr:repressible alkaline phosphatase [Verticillium alfalfae VaMs.102]EEY20504.1 repressible alkaline phosphatase [Verticillium alfalfae VaMs.102]
MAAQAAPNDRTPLLDDTERRENINDDSESNSDNGHSPSSGGSNRLREVLLFVWALLATAAVIVLAVWSQHNRQTGHGTGPTPEKRNLIFMHVEGLSEDDTLTLDKHFWGTSPHALLQLARHRQRAVHGLLVRQERATTAPSHHARVRALRHRSRGWQEGRLCDGAGRDHRHHRRHACLLRQHVLTRAMNDDIALQEVGDGPLGRVVDLMLGGGRCHFLPNGTADSCRLDETDVVKIAQEKYNWTYASDRAGFDALKLGENVQLPALGLFAHYNVPFEIDRRNLDHIYPSLTEMTHTALRALEKETEHSDHGFFLMIEGSRIDHAGHINDPAAQVHEVLQYDAAFQAVLDFIEKSETETILVATSDHETGGLGTALQEPGHLPVYNWFPRALAKANASSEFLSLQLAKHIAENPGEHMGKLRSWVNETLIYGGLGITDVHPEELDALVEAPLAAITTFAAIISLRAHVGWSTHGHTAVDVNIYSSGGRDTEKIRGNVENTDVGKFLRDWLDLDVAPITEELKSKLGKVNRNDLAAMDAVSGRPAEAAAAGEVPQHWMEQHMREVAAI